ncbi:hypothetical protein SAMN04489867_3136 [Pedococcus dokdonensis]|uniref:Uncharacterized protein n=1 Tax=Pedococcus dokdonensis TaxID=443156 RepID=A0A1H0U4V0_9MICO|nr:hypothetical protein [Pedococcus dokdonensis]SDP61223.1 hypothetical protein SAMN04489867_3136 [Pedococcus dokdonensis]
MTMNDGTELQRLIVVANSEVEEFVEPAECVDRLHQVQTARAALARLDAPSLRASLEASRSARGNGSAQ